MKRLLALILALSLSANAFATCELRADTATNVPIGMFVDATDGVTTEETLTLEDTEIFLFKEGGTSIAAKNDTTNATHMNAGVYYVDLNATDTNTEGLLSIYVEDGTTDALRAWRNCMVLGANFYDTKYGATSLITTQDVGLADSGTVTVTNQTTFVLSAGHANNDAYNDHTICVEDGTNWDCEEIADYVGSTTTVTLENALDFTVATSDNYRVFAPGQTATLNTVAADASALPSAAAIVNEWESQSQSDPTGFHVNVLEVGGTSQTANDNGADINAVLVDTAEIGVAGAGLTEAAGTGDQFTAVPYNSVWDAQIQSEVTDAFNAYDPATRAELASDIASIAALLGIAEPGAVPAFSADAGDVLSWLLTLSRNEINQTATTKTIRNDADSGNIATCAVSDDGTTFTRAECN